MSRPENNRGFAPVLIVVIISVLLLGLFLSQNWINNRLDALFMRNNGGSTELELNVDRWLSYEQSTSLKQIKPVAKILELNLEFNRSMDPVLTITGLNIKNGYPQKQVADQNQYFLVLKDSDGNVLIKHGFSVPDKLFGPPPLPGDTSTVTIPVQNIIPFTITTEWMDDIFYLEIVDIEDSIVLTQDVSDIPVIDNKPSFNSITKEPANSGARSGIMPLLNNLLPGRVYAQTEPKEKLDITFVGSGFSESEKQMFKEAATGYAEYLLTYEPFKSRKEDIAFHYVENTQDLGCKAQGRMLVCNYSEVQQVINSSGAPGEQIVVIVNSQDYAGSGGVISVSYSGGMAKHVVVHEIGHTLGHLNDEYPTEYGVTYKNTNCFNGTPPNVDWDGMVKSDEYTLGCSSPHWYRSSVSSVMLSLGSENFNAVSQKWLNYYIDQYTRPVVLPSFQPSAQSTTVPAGSATPLQSEVTDILKKSAYPSPLKVRRPLLNLYINDKYSYATVKVPPNSDVEIRWDTDIGTFRCIASGDWSGDKPLSGKETIKNITKDEKYFLTCHASTYVQERWVAVKIVR